MKSLQSTKMIFSLSFKLQIMQWTSLCCNNLQHIHFDSSSIHYDNHDNCKFSSNLNNNFDYHSLYDNYFQHREPNINDKYFDATASSDFYNSHGNCTAADKYPDYSGDYNFHNIVRNNSSNIDKLSDCHSTHVNDLHDCH